MNYSEPSQQSTASEPLAIPSGLKVVATSFLVIGLLSVVEIIFSGLRGRLHIDLNVLTLLIGIGLWRLNARAHWWSLFYLRFGLGVMALAMAFAASRAPNSVKWLAAYPMIAALSGFLWWQIKVLRRADVHQLFHDPELKARIVGSSAGRRYQFSLATLFVAMLVVGIVAARVTDELNDPGEAPFGYLRRDATCFGSTADGRPFSYGVGYFEPKSGRGKKDLLYVVFSNASDEFPLPMRFESSSGNKKTAWLFKPDGTETKLPEPGRQLYEFCDGGYRESNERVSMRQFKDFVRSKPEAYSIDALLEFARTHPDGD